MGFLSNFFKKKDGQSNADAPVDKNSFVIEWDNKLCKKCNYGEKLSVLTKQERIFFVVQELEREVNNGGFSQYFSNASGSLAMELVDAFTEIGAWKTADICKKAISVFGDEVPADRDLRFDFMDNMDEETEEIWSQCDDAFYGYEDDLTELCYAYILKNMEHFG